MPSVPAASPLALAWPTQQLGALSGPSLLRLTMLFIEHSAAASMGLRKHRLSRPRYKEPKYCAARYIVRRAAAS